MSSPSAPFSVSAPPKPNRRSLVAAPARVSPVLAPIRVTPVRALTASSTPAKRRRSMLVRLSTPSELVTVTVPPLAVTL